MKKSILILGAICLALIAPALTACGGEPDTVIPEPTHTPTAVPPTLTPEPTPQIVLGLDAIAAVEMLNAKGWRFVWVDDIDAYEHSVNVNLNFFLHVTEDVITGINVFVIDGPSFDWEAPTDQFFADCNLPMPMLGGMAAFMDTYQDTLSTEGSVRMYPAPGIEFKVVEWGVGLQFDMLSYTLID